MMNGFGPELQRHRITANLSQSRLADRAGFDHSYVSRLESGARRPTRDAIGRLATALAVTGPDYDRMLAAAGFLPKDPASLIAEEPAVAAVLQLLGDDTVSPQYRNNVREILSTLAMGAPREATYPLS